MTLVGIHAAWVDLATLGLVAAGASLRWLARTQSHANAAAAAAAANEGRAAILAKTCEESEAGWAQLVRDALRLQPEPMDIEVGYRDAAATLAPSPALTAIHQREISRLRFGTGIGLSGAVGMLAGAKAMHDTAGLEVFGALFALAAIALAWRLIVRFGRARAALSSTFAALPAIVSHLEAAPPERALDVSTLPIRFTSARWFGYMLALPASIALLVLASDVADVITPANARNHLFAPVFFLPLVGVVLMLLATTSVDVTRSDLVVTRRVLGVTYARTRVPVEIVRGFSTRAHGRKYFTGLVVDLVPVAAEIEVYAGDGAIKAASDLNRIFAITAT